MIPFLAGHPGRRRVVAWIKPSESILKLSQNYSFPLFTPSGHEMKRRRQKNDFYSYDKNSPRRGPDIFFRYSNSLETYPGRISEDIIVQ